MRGSARLLVAGSLLGSLLVAPAALALAPAPRKPSLTVTVTPPTVHRHKVYTVTITATYTKREVTGVAYLVAFLQYSAVACKATARAEHALPQELWSLDYAGKAQGSPFTRVDSWRANGPTGMRRVCAYLYPKKVSPTSRVKPIAVGSAAFRNV